MVKANNEIDRTKIKYVIDIGLIISFLLVAVTGIIKFRGFLSGLGIDTTNLPWRNISLLHDWSGVVMAILVVAHLILEFNWLVCVTKNYLGKK